MKSLHLNCSSPKGRERQRKGREGTKDQTQSCIMRKRSSHVKVRRGKCDDGFWCGDGGPHFLTHWRCFRNLLKPRPHLRRRTPGPLVFVCVGLMTLLRLNIHY